jgi:alpha-D-xyloside xylohydrolase
MRLMPYLYQVAIDAHCSGVPMMRAMLLEFPDDPACAYLDRQYMLGGDLLVAPVFSDDGDVEHYVPAGVWIDFLTCEPVSGPGWIRRRCDVFHLPLLVRPNAVIPVGSTEDRPDYDYADSVTLEVFAFEHGARREVVLPRVQDGSEEARFVVSRTGDRLHVRAETQKPWRVRIVDPELRVADALGHDMTRDSRGTLLTPRNPAEDLEVVLDKRRLVPGTLGT